MHFCWRWLNKNSPSARPIANANASRPRACRCSKSWPTLTLPACPVSTSNGCCAYGVARGEYLAKAEPILLVGNPGLGKTHVAVGVALAACRQGHRVRFYTAAGLVNELIQAQDEHRLPRLLTAALKQKLIVLDELGFIPFSPLGAQLLFQFCSTLYERVALIITTNLKFADWPQVFGDERLTAALLDRLTHRAHILDFTGESFRFRQRMQREAKKKKE